MCLAASVGRPMKRYDESGQKFSLRSGNFIASMKWIRGSSTSLQTLSITSGELMRVQANNFVVNGHRHTRTEDEAIALNGPLDENSFVCSFRTNTDIRWHFSTFARRHPAPATECQKENRIMYFAAQQTRKTIFKVLHRNFHPWPGESREVRYRCTPKVHFIYLFLLIFSPTQRFARAADKKCCKYWIK